MSLPNIPSDIPKPPKNTGLNRRLLIAIFFAVWLLLLLVVVLLHHTAPRRQHPQAAQPAFNNEAALQQIKSLREQRDENTLPITVATAPTQRAVIASQVVLSKRAMQLANNAPLLVYHQTFAQKIQRSTLTQNNAAARVPVGTHTLKAGTILPATLLTGIQSDLPGTIIAKIRRDVFDTATGQTVLIPQGSTLIGRYDHAIHFGQSRVLIVWSQLIFPNGKSMALNALPGIDLQGQSGLHDRVNHHYFRLLSSTLLLSLFSTAQQLAQSHSTNALNSSALLTAAIDQQLSETSMQWIQKNMNVAATITIRSGTNFNVLLTQDMHFSSAYPVR